MSAYVFIGPTVSCEEARAACDVVCLPPVRQGDIYRVAARERPQAIGVVDGIFQHVPAVWHKEILWAMSQGIHVFGAASMGALRAAELHPFGMYGVGRIFEAYRTGVLEPYRDEDFEDDDEVAVIHGPPETGFVGISEAMVNIRCTLAQAACEGVISGATRDALVRITKARFYQDRTYDALLQWATTHDLPDDEVSGLRGWLQDGQVNQKRDDALAMLAAMQELRDAYPGPKIVDYGFEPTTLWENAIALSGVTYRGTTLLDGSSPTAGVLEELRLDGSSYLTARRTATQRQQALGECDRRAIAVGRKELDRTTAQFRRAAGLRTQAQFERWLAGNDLDQGGFVRLMRDEVRLRKLATASGTAVEPYLLDHLRYSDQYARLAARARDKQRLFGGAVAAEAEVDGPTALGLVVWYFERRLGIEVPADVGAYAHSVGFDSLAAFRRALWREYLYQARGRGLERAPG
jgi:hypothetical protein